jgi:CubicO group peptidase (beta-lactamase class C family)
MRRTQHTIAFSVLLTILGASPTRAADALPRANPESVGLSASGLERTAAPFREAVERNQIAGAVLLVARHGKIAQLEAIGMQDVEEGVAMSPASIFRIASMTKPITSTAVMMLADQGRLDILDPVSKYLPEFKFMKVAAPPKAKDAKDSATAKGAGYDTVSAYRPITVRDLLMHTSGLCYRFTSRPTIGKLYAQAGICDGLTPSDHSLAENVRRLAALPLLHQPGTAWEYGLNTDVLGRLVEVVSGQSLDAFLAERIFKPLRMEDTHFVLPESKRTRLAALYEPGPAGKNVPADEGPTKKGELVYSASLPYRGTDGYNSGGAGLVSTAVDYARFLQMFLNRGELDGARLLRPQTVASMTHDQTGDLPLSIGGHGPSFGYGFGVITERGTDRGSDPVGTFSWGGIYYTDFWADPSHEVIGIMLTQIYPSGQLKLRQDFHRLVNESIRQ